MNSNDLKQQAYDYFMMAVKAGDPAYAVQQALNNYDDILPQTAKKLSYIAVGKAAVPMMRAMQQYHASDHAILVTNDENAPLCDDAIHQYCQSFVASHPIPNDKGYQAAQHIIRHLTTLDEDNHVVLLLSGGGSALTPAPIDGLSLNDKILVNQLLITSGADIHHINKVRKYLSKLKGGGFAQLAKPATIACLILSDVPSDDLSSVASGPTFAHKRDRDDICAILKQYHLWQKLPQHIQDICAQPRDDMMEIDHVRNYAVASNRDCVNVIKQNIGHDGQIIMKNGYLIGDVGDAAQEIYDDICQASHHYTGKLILLYGGETSVKVNGNGKGGRNQELAVRLALMIDNKPLPANIKQWCFLSGGSDGIDGNSDAAGGIVDQDSIKRMKNNNIAIEKELANNNAYAMLSASDDLLMIGATGTNFADIQIVLLDI